MFTRDPPSRGYGSPVQGNALVEGIVKAVDKFTKAGK